MIIYGATEKGRRKINQDNFLIYHPDDDFIFIAVADGMGGTFGGDIASKLVIDKCESVITMFYKAMNYSFDLKEVLNKIFFEAQKVIRKKVNENPLLQGMGTTLSCLLIIENKYVWGNLGDSRIYRLTKHGFIRITKDHTQLEEYISENYQNLTEEMILNYRNLLTRVISGGNDEPDIYPLDGAFERLTDEGFLICSDGLLLKKNEEEGDRFFKVLLKSESLKEFIDKLIISSYELGSYDNITCIGVFNKKNGFSIEK